MTQKPVADSLYPNDQEIHEQVNTISMRRPEIWLYFVGLMAVGSATGVITGASASPVVSTVIPLLFALIGGTSGVYIINANFSEATVWLRLKIIGIGLTFFSISFLLASFYGIHLRTGVRVSDFLNRSIYSDVRTMENLFSSEDAIEVLILRRKLEIVGASEQEQAAILKQFKQELSYLRNPKEASSNLTILANLGEELQKELAQIINIRGIEKVPDSYINLERELKRYVKDFKFLADKAKRGELLSRSATSSLIQDNILSVSRAINHIEINEDRPIPVIRTYKHRLNIAHDLFYVTVYQGSYVTTKQRLDDLVKLLAGKENIGAVERERRPAYTVPP